jgi:hypothetical protein
MDGSKTIPGGRRRVDKLQNMSTALQMLKMSDMAERWWCICGVDEKQVDAWR